jgi:hypothetical protein
MSADLRASARVLVPVTLAVVVAAVVVPGRAALLLRVYALFLCVVALGLTLSALRRAYPPASAPGRPRRREADRQPAGLARLEHLLSLGVAGAFDYHHRVRPRLTRLASGLLASRRRIAIEDAELARAILGGETWELVRPDRPPPEDRLARGVPIAELDRAIAALERV